MTSRRKILVVEDNEDNRRILVYRLGKIGDFDIREATNGREAIEAVQGDPPDLVFMTFRTIFATCAERSRPPCRLEMDPADSSRRTTQGQRAGGSR